MFYVVEQRNAHVACQGYIGSVGEQNLVQKVGGGAFALGAGDAYRLIVKQLQEYVGLRRYLVGISDDAVEIESRNAGRFQYQVVAVGMFKVVFAQVEDYVAVVCDEFIACEETVSVGNGYRLFRQKFAYCPVR